MTHVNTHTNQASKTHKRRGTRATSTSTTRARPSHDDANTVDMSAPLAQRATASLARTNAKNASLKTRARRARATPRAAATEGAMPKRCARDDDAMRRERARGDARGEGERELRAWPRVGMIFARVRAGREARGRRARGRAGADRRGRRVTSAIRRAWITGDGNARCRGDDAARARSCAPCEMKDTDGCAYET